MLKDKNKYEHYYITKTTAEEIYFDAYIDKSMTDSRIFYQLFSEYYDGDGNWIGDGEDAKKEIKK